MVDNRVPPGEIVAATLRQYADRGVFGALEVKQRRGGRWEYTFTWLFRRPMTLMFDPGSHDIRFHRLLPHVDHKSPMVAALRTLIEGRKRRDLPAHRRLDGRRARAACVVSDRDFSLTLNVRGSHYEYAVRGGLNLINELFLLLHEMYPDYLVEHFGLSSD